MGYVITAGAGLLLGIALLVWALRERSKRHEAERAADKERLGRIDATNTANQNLARALDLESQLKRVDDQLASQRGRLNECRTRLAEGGQPAAIKEWLDNELKAEEL